MSPRARGKTVVLVGAGGVIGSHLVPHLARTSGVGRIVLVDGDEYSESNLWTQDIRRRDLGRAKAVVQARRLREIDGTLPVEAIAAFVEDVPLGRLRADVLLAAVDSKAARRSLNTIAWHLGMPLIDSGVNGDELLARVNVYRPGPAAPCLECTWNADAYDTLEVEHPCTVTGTGTSRGTAVATNAPSSLGALAASLQALECRKLLADQWDEVAVGRQVTISARTHRTLVTTLTVNPQCRFQHEIWRIDPLTLEAGACTVAQALEIGRRALDTAAAVGLTVNGQLFAKRLTCIGCGAARDLAPYLYGRLGPVASVCAACGGAMRVGGFDALDRLYASDLSPAGCEAPLTSLGLRTGDVVSMSDESSSAHFELGGEP